MIVNGIYQCDACKSIAIAPAIGKGGSLTANQHFCERCANERIPAFAHRRTGREKELHDATLACVTACVEAKHAGEHVPTEIQFAVSRLALLFRASDEIAAEINRNRE